MANKLKKYVAFCIACEGLVATACADDVAEEAEARQLAAQWERRGDVAAVIEYDLEQVPTNPFTWCSCPRPRAHLHRPPVTVEWVPVTDRLPDADTTVMIYAPAAASEPVWFGYLDAEGYNEDDGMCWCDTDGYPLAVAVTHWMDLPAPPEDV